MSVSQYHYEAINLLDRTRREGLISAATEREARERLREQDLIPTRLETLEQQDARAARLKRRDWLRRLRGVGLREKIAFSRSLAMMLKAGVPMTEALSHLASVGVHPAFQRMVGEIRSDILAGSTFSDAIGRRHKAFDAVYCAVIRAGEASGELVASLNRMTDLMTRAQRLRARIITASVYPLIVLGIVLAVFALLTVYVMPTFATIYDRMDAPMPWPTRAFLWISEMLRASWIFLLPALGLTIAAMARWLSAPTGREALQRHLMRLPWLGELLRLLAASHFLSTLSVTFGAGIPITDALPLATQTVANPIVREALAPAVMRIQGGERLSEALAKTGALGDIELLMTASGEESGELDAMLTNAFEFVEEEVSQRLDRLITLMEPAALTVLGVVVGAMALAIYLPMFSLYESP